MEDKNYPNLQIYSQADVVTLDLTKTEYTLSTWQMLFKIFLHLPFHSNSASSYCFVFSFVLSHAICLRFSVSDF